MHIRPGPLFFAHLLALASCMAAFPAQAVLFGANVAADKTPVEHARRAAVLMRRNITAARIGIIDSWGDTDVRRDQAVQIARQGGVVESGIFPGFTWDHSCSPDLAGIERQAYAETRVAVDKVKDVVHDFELMNENQMRPEIDKEVPRDTAGANTAPYENKPCVASLAAALRGMAQAVSDLRAESGLPLRSILGVVGRDWGFLRFMQEQGVKFDVVGFHVYPYLRNESLLTDSWWGPGGPLRQLAAFGKPVHVNEFNCGEIYRDTYENEGGKPVTEDCLRGFARHLRDLVEQKLVDIEVIHVYELVDNPALPGSEGHFGLMHTLDRDKPHMALYTAFAGGELTADERLSITRRGLLTEPEIDRYKELARRRRASGTKQDSTEGPGERGATAVRDCEGCAR